MKAVKITGWEKGLLKISLNKLLQEINKCSFVEAKNIVDSIIDGNEYTFYIKENDIDSVSKRLKEIKTIFTIE